MKIAIKYNLQKRIPAAPSIWSALHVMPAYWQSRFFYKTLPAARVDKKRFATKGERWRIVKITEEVVR